MINFKILLVGDASPQDRIIFYRNAFKGLGCEVEILNTKGLYKISFLNRVLNRFILKTPVYFWTKNLNSIVVKKAIENNPDFILFFKPIYISPTSILKIKSRGIKIFSWYPDDIFYPKNSSNFFYKSIFLYDCHFSTKSFNVKELVDFGAKRAVFLPHAVDLSCHHPVEVSTVEKEQLGADIIFVGTYAEDKRTDYLERLCQDGYDIKIYGNGWRKHPKNSCLFLKKFIKFKDAYCEDSSKIFNASKIILAFLRKHNRDAQTGRTYEIPACGAFMLHERTDEAKAIFKEGKEADFFGSYEELKKKVDFYLSHEEKRREIAKNGYLKALTPPFSYDNRAEIIIKTYLAL